MTDRPNNQDAGIMGPEHPSDDELSAYLNRDHADLAARERLEAHLATCAECRERLSELRAVARLLRGLEHPVPKRSFRLDPSQVRVPEPEPLRIDPWIVRIQPALRRLTAIAAVLLVVLVTADVLAHRNSTPSGSREVFTTSSASRALDSTSVMSAGAAESAPQSTSASMAPAATAASGGVANSASNSAGSGSVAESTVSSAETTSGAAASDSAGSREAVVPAASAAAITVQPSEVSGQPLIGESQEPNAAADGGHSYWRLVELAVGVVVIWLLFLTIVLPRTLRQRRSLQVRSSPKEER